MFKNNIQLIDESWNIIHEYKSRCRPSVDEYVYLEPNYYKVVAVIHNIPILTNKKNITVVVKEYKNFMEKNN